MKQIHKEALFLTILFGNVSLSPVSGLVLDKSFQNSREASNRYSENLLNLNAKPIYSSSFEPFVGINIPLSKLWQYCIKSRKCVPRVRVKPLQHEPFKPIRLQPVIGRQLSILQVNSVVSNAMSNAKKEQTMQRLLNAMSKENARLLEQSIRADATAKIRSEFLIYDLRSLAQGLINQEVKEAAESYDEASNAAYQAILARYKASFGRLTNQDVKYVELAAQQAIEKQHRDKRNVVVLSVSGVTTSATTAIIIRSAVANAKLKVQADNDSQNSQILLINRYLLYRLPKKILR